MKTLTIKLTEEEYAILAALSKKQRRNPTQQAASIIVDKIKSSRNSLRREVMEEAQCAVAVSPEYRQLISEKRTERINAAHIDGKQ